ncbi:MAG: energy-coupling factor transporter transmembrane protein EcfT [Coriobacteriales bacterium]|nr:energy-coupling factor transporter transmembrane protein EcfT [Coriobacteriales bacterium]
MLPEASIKKKPFALDPRTKLLLVFMEAVFVLATAGGEHLFFMRIALTALPFLLLLTARRYKTCAIGLAVLGVCTVLEYLVFPQVSGVLAAFLLIIITIVTRFFPAYMMGVYVIKTTTVSEFKAAMERMHVPDELTIPLCVMFRFFPTVHEEAVSINAAMRMRGIQFGGGKALSMLEYRLVPMISCSAKIGEELSAAALTRGLGKSRKRTNICRIGFGVFDWCVIAFALAIIVYWAWGFVQ